MRCVPAYAARTRGYLEGMVVRGVRSLHWVPGRVRVRWRWCVLCGEDGCEHWRMKMEWRERTYLDTARLEQWLVAGADLGFRSRVFNGIVFVFVKAHSEDVM